ncbi:hypothetical protein [Pseudoprimorskyibacter insulae]|uniref:Uncharacterized protein n=1 Tax=Pseudoprimorskyibacter insulae TaxID=1695997 RepID=A0A2R8AYV1_9RHOB|nr:hypothetical protein [Pseudoprimorskyibacter insulae]SPF81225.1 hypothetical protein PRI8871_03047 [Pseudoprimorskyibacter insulae]
MSCKIANKSLTSGVWTATLIASNRPRIRAVHLDRDLPNVTVTETESPDEWALSVPIHASLINDGVQTFVILNDETGEKIDSFTLISGEELSDDIRAEVDLLRAELDMLKRAFRRHCLETQ